MTTTTEDRFWSKVSRSEGCWIWTASVQPSGYGQLKIDGAVRFAHRVAFELTYGPIPPGAVIDHTCRQRACVNPTHLRTSTVKQNAENRASDCGGASGVRGVRWDKARGKWSAAVTHNGKTMNLGRFDDIALAEEAAKSARMNLFTHNTVDRQEATA